MQSPRPEPMAVIGAGSWGTALAIQLARAGHPTRLWGRDSAQLEAMQQARCNVRYLPRPSFPQRSRPWRIWQTALEGRAMRWWRCPRTRFARPWSGSSRTSTRDTRIAWASKGFEIATGLLPHQVAHEVFGDAAGAVSRVRRSREKSGADLPTAMTVASRDEVFAKELVSASVRSPISAPTRKPDIVGVEVGGAVKNVIAIGSGIADGMGFGANTRVALITRGLAEMMRLGVKLGAAARDLHGPRRSRRSRAHLHRRSIAQPAPGAGAGPRAVARGCAAQHRSSGRRRDGGGRGAQRRRSARASICRSAWRCIASCTRAKPVRAAVQALMGREVRSETE